MRILLADDQREVRSALRLLLEQEPGVSVVGEVKEASELLPWVCANALDLVLLDWELPGLRAVEAISALQAARPHVWIVPMSGRPEARDTALAAGADAFVSKGDPPDRLLATIRAIRAGGHAGTADAC